MRHGTYAQTRHFHALPSLDRGLALPRHLLMAFLSMRTGE
jgi:hypothetical protein